MKNFTTTIVFLLLMVNNYAQEIVTGEYFFNSDPGHGNGTEITFEVGDEPNFELDIPFEDDLPKGMNILYFRFKNTDNVWSHNYSKSILNEGNTIASQKINEVRYYMDTVAVGNEVLLNFQGDSLSAVIDTVIDLSTLDYGLHYLFVQAVNQNNTPGLLTRKSIWVTQEPELDEIESVSYYFTSEGNTTETFEYEFSVPSLSINEDVFLNFNELTNNTSYTLTASAKSKRGAFSYPVSVGFVFRENNSPFILSDALNLEMSNGAVLKISMDTLFNDDDIAFGDRLSFLAMNFSSTSIEESITWLEDGVMEIKPADEITGSFTFTIEASDLFSEMVSLPVNLTIVLDDTSSNYHLTENGIKVYPNPADGVLFIENNLNLSDGVVEVIDVRGQIVRTVSLINLTQIDISDLENGIYFVRIENGDRVFHRKVIVQ